MSGVWKRCGHLFDKDDGSLPDIEFEFTGPREVMRAYAFIQGCASSFESTESHYWSRGSQAEVPLTFRDDPAQAVVSGDAEPFHVVFGGVQSPTGKQVPSLGVFVFPSVLALDYRMGSGWHAESVTGLFEIISGIVEFSEGESFEHKGNLNESGTELLQTYRQWASAGAA